jgi:hypothetical protein
VIVNDGWIEVEVDAVTDDQGKCLVANVVMGKHNSNVIIKRLVVDLLSCLSFRRQDREAS